MQVINNGRIKNELILLKPATLYLSLSILCLIAMLFFPVFLVLIGDDFYEYRLNGIYFIDSSGDKQIERYPYGIIDISLVVYNIVTLFLVKKLNVQLTMVRMNYILHLVFLSILYYSLTTIQNNNPDLEILFGYRGFYFPIASLAFLFLANRSIKQEEKLMEIFEGKGKKKKKKK